MYLFAKLNHDASYFCSSRATFESLLVNKHANVLITADCCHFRKNV